MSWIRTKESAVSAKIQRSTRSAGKLVDCGSASERTKGFPFLLLFEFAWPPFDRLLL
jgi:hypothetical protein